MLDPERWRASHPRRRAGPAPAGGRPALPAPRPRRQLTLDGGDRRARRRPRSPRSRRRPGADVRVDAARLRGAAGLRRLPHAPAVRRLARGRVRDEGHRRAVRGDRALGRRDRVVGARARPRRPTTRCSRRRGRSRPRCSRPARRRSRARPATASRATASAAPSRLGRALGERVAQTIAVTGLFAHAVPAGLRPPTRGWTRSSALAPTRPTSTRSTSTSSRVAFANEHLERLGGSPRARGLPLRAHVEQFATQPLGAGRARRRRALGRPPRVPAPRRPRPARGERVRRRAAPGRRVPRRRAASPPARALADAGAICVLGHRPQPRHVAGRVDAGDRRPRRAPLRLDRCARRCSRCTLNAA